MPCSSNYLDLRNSEMYHFLESQKLNKQQTVCTEQVLPFFWTCTNILLIYALHLLWVYSYLTPLLKQWRKMVFLKWKYCKNPERVLYDQEKMEVGGENIVLWTFDSAVLSILFWNLEIWWTIYIVMACWQWRKGGGV